MGERNKWRWWRGREESSVFFLPLARFPPRRSRVRSPAHPPHRAHTPTGHTQLTSVALLRAASPR
jgi:hypothetical protein